MIFYVSMTLKGAMNPSPLLCSPRVSGSVSFGRLKPTVCSHTQHSRFIVGMAAAEIGNAKPMPLKLFPSTINALSISGRPCGISWQSRKFVSVSGRILKQNYCSSEDTTSHLEHRCYKQHRSDVKFVFIKQNCYQVLPMNFKSPTWVYVRFHQHFLGGFLGNYMANRYIFGQLHGQRFPG